MPTDVLLDQGDGSFVVIDARVAKVAGSDFMLDSPERRNGPRPFRRALVHNQNDGLTVNFGGDYPGGVTVDTGVTVSGTLVVRGGISYEAKGTSASIPLPGTGSGTTTITVDLDTDLADLRSQIRQLTARVTALEARP